MEPQAVERVYWIIHTLKYFGIVLVLTLCGTGLPIPEEVPVVAGAFFSHPAGGAVMKWYFALPACFFGALCGDCVMYAAGYHWGYGVLRNHRWFVRFQHPENEPFIERALERHGLKVLLIARFLVGLRSPIYLAAGILRIPFRQFLLYDAIAAAPVVGTTFTLGYLFAPHLERLMHDIRTAKYVIMALVLLIAMIVAGTWYFKRRYFRESAGRQEGASDESKEAASVGEESKS
jgi:membrane protein DedA with SNARE-associated domain